MSQNMIPWSIGNSSFEGNLYDFKYMDIGKKKAPILIVQSDMTWHTDAYVTVLQYIDGKVKHVMSGD